MVLQLNPLLEGLEAARVAAVGVTSPDDEVTVDDQDVHWVFEYLPRGNVLGGGISVSVAKDDLRVLQVIRGQ